jgi:hypothetical protein
MQRFIAGSIPERFVEVDAARLLLILHRFSRAVDPSVRAAPYFPAHPADRHLTPEYYLHKLDFLLRYPGYFAYEVIELHRLGIPAAESAENVRQVVLEVLRNREPELKTQPFRKFWYGAYERIADVEAWWHARQLIYTQIVRRADGKPQKHYFLAASVKDVAERLIAELEHAKWYDLRLALIQQFFGDLTAAQIRGLQYSHATYREAQIAQVIPDLPLEVVIAHFHKAIGEPLGAKMEG